MAKQELSDTEKARGIMRRAFAKMVGGCSIQDGWPCRTCFFAVAEDYFGFTSEESHALWLLQLKMRQDGEYGDGPPLYKVRVETTEAGHAHQAKVKAYQESLINGRAN